MSLAPMLVSAAEGGSSSGVNHWLIGALVLAIFVAMVAGLLAFGAGREHS
jgi:hypothetical protein